jgi:hypothetical protein
MRKLITASLLTLILLTSTTQAADEGIKVHGHWTFEIYNPDGSFDKKVEFENALTTVGGDFILNVLNGGIVRNYGWNITITGPTTVGPCLDGSSSSRECFITSETGTDTSAEFHNLTHVIELFPITELILSGSFVATNGSNASIGNVQTDILSCSNPSVRTQTDCTGSGDVKNTILFTAKALNTAVTVSTGQLVQITVKISIG